MWILVVVLLLIAGIVLWGMSRSIPRLLELYHWHMTINKTRWVEQGNGFCRDCRHAKIRSNANKGPGQKRRGWFCMYYWCQLSYSLLCESARRCKACNKGLLQYGEIPPYIESDKPNAP